MDSEPEFIPRLQLTRRYQAPSSLLPGEFICKQLLIPADSDNAIADMIFDLLSQAINPLIWQESETSVDRFELAALLSVMLQEFDFSSCDGGQIGENMNFFVLEHRVTNAAPGETVPVNASARRNLNTEVMDVGDNVVLSNNQFEVQAGTWLFICTSPSVGNGGCWNWIKDVASGTELFRGKIDWQQPSTNTWHTLLCVAPIVLLLPTVLELWQKSESGYSAGFGFNTGNWMQVYSQVVGIRLVAP